jgi:hypothetical protein
VIHDGLKPILALVRPDVPPPSIRWREANLILHARYAVIIVGNMPPIENRLRGRAGRVAGTFASNRMHFVLHRPTTRPAAGPRSLMPVSTVPMRGSPQKY